MVVVVDVDCVVVVVFVKLVGRRAECEGAQPPPKMDGSRCKPVFDVIVVFVKLVVRRAELDLY